MVTGSGKVTIDASGNLITTGGVQAGGSLAPSFTNRVLNGDMRLDQRNAGSNPVSIGNTAASASNAAYGPDRWQLSAGANSGFLAAQQVPLSAADKAAIGNVSSYATALAPAVMPSLTTGLTTLITFEGSNAVDTLGGATGPTVTGTPQYVAGKIGSTAVYVANEANVTAATRAANVLMYSYTQSTPITVSCWIYATKFSSTASTCAVPWTFGSASAQSLSMQTYSTSATTANVSASYAGVGVNPSTVMSTNAWYHVVCTYMPGISFSTYVNGAFIGTNTSSVPSSFGSANGLFSLGDYTNVVNVSPFAGYIDDFRIYNRALTQQDITALYNYNGSTIPMQVSSSLLSGLVAYVPFEGGSVQDVQGTLTAPVWTGTPAFSTGKVGSTALFMNNSANVSAQSKASNQIAYTGIIPPYSSHTMAFWVNMTQITSGFSFILGFGSTSTDCAGLGWQASTGNWSYFLGAANVTTTYTYTPTANTWYHVSLQYVPGTSATIFFNGVQVSQNTSSIPANLNVSGVFFNIADNYKPGAVQPFAGYLDDFRLYNRILTAAEIGLLASNTPAMAIPNTIPFTNTSLPTGMVSQFTLNNTLADAQGINTLSTTGSISYVNTLTGKAVYLANEANTNATAAAQTFSSNYLTSSYNLPTNVTVSMWFNAKKSTVNMLFNTNSTTSALSNALAIYIDASNYLWGAFNSTANTGSGYPIALGSWYHVAVTYSNGTANWYANGVKIGNTLSYTYAVNGFILGGGRDATNIYPFAGYISDFRLYSSALTQAQIAAIYSASADNYASSLVSYYPFEPVAAPTSGLITNLTFDSTTADAQSGASVTTTGGTMTYNTSIQKVGTACLDLTLNSQGAAPSKYLIYSLPSMPAIFTICFWMQMPSFNGYPMPIAINGPGLEYEFAFNPSGGFYINNMGSSTVSYTFSTNTWYHVCCVFGASCTAYINGVSVGTGTTGITTSGSITTLTVGSCTARTNFGFKGYLDDFRIYNRALSGTEIAQLYSGNLYDVQGAYYLASTGTMQYVGGIVGTQALYLANEANLAANQKPTNSAAISSFNLNTMTSISCWFYMTGLPASTYTSCVWDIGAGTGTENLALYIQYASSTAATVYAGPTGSSIAYGTQVKANTWYHACIVYNPSTSTSLYINGVLITNVSSASAASTGQTIRLGGAAASVYNCPFAGYIDDFRIYNKALAASDVAALYYAIQPNAYALYQQPIEGQALADLALGTSSVSSSSMTVSAWLKNNTPTAQSFSLALNAANPGLTTWIPFENGSVADVMGGMTGPVVTGTLALSSSTYKVGASALDLTANTVGANATNYVMYALPSVLSPPITMSMWFNMSSLPGASYYEVVMFGTPQSANVNSVDIGINSSSIYSNFYIGNTSLITVSYSTVLSVNTWYHVCITIPYGGTAYMYLNGALVTSTANMPSSGTFQTSGGYSVNALKIGGHMMSTAANGAFKGYVDDFRLYNSALSAAQIQQIYQNNASSTTLSSYLLPRSVVYQTPSISANAWQKLSLTVPGDVLGTYSTDNTKALSLALCLGAGANYSTSNLASTSNNSSNVWQNALVYNASSNQIFGASSNNFLANPYNSVYLTGVQLEKGTSASPFEILPLATVLPLAQRYYEKSYSQTNSVSSITTNGAIGWSVLANNLPVHTVQYKTQKRAAPTVTLVNPSTGTAGFIANGDAVTSGVGTLSSASDKSFGVSWSSANSGQTVGQNILAHFAADAEL